MIYKTYLEKYNIPNNKEIWAFDCNDCKAEDKIYIEASICKPIKGIIKNEYFNSCEYRDGKLKCSRINKFDRNYADTYEEAKEAFNNLVQDRITKLQKEIKYLSSILLQDDEKNK